VIHCEGEQHTPSALLSKMGCQRTTRAQACCNIGQTPGAVLPGQNDVWATSNADTSRPLSPSLAFSNLSISSSLNLTSIGRLAMGPRSCCITRPTCSHRFTVSDCDPSQLASASPGPEEDTHSNRLGTALYSSSKASSCAVTPNLHCRCSSGMLRSHRLIRPTS
jgi:hypothetical protein